MRLIVAVVVGVVLLLCLGGVGVIVSLYDNATAIKRSEPAAVVKDFMRAYFVDRDDKQVALYSCTSGGDFSALSALRTSIIDREKKFQVKVVVSLASLVIVGNGESQRTANADLSIAGTKNGQVQSSRDEEWTFGLVQDNGWRVCSASKVT